MPGALRFEYVGAFYHVMNRGDRGEDIFLGDEDRDRLPGTLGEVCVRADRQIHAYCLMGNRFHLVVETPLPTLVSGMKWMPGSYAQCFNARHRLRGHLFGCFFEFLFGPISRSMLL